MPFRTSPEVAELQRKLENVGVTSMYAATAILPRKSTLAADGSVIEWGPIVEDSELVRAFDAQPTLITTPNAGIPAYLTTFYDPKLIEILLTPNNAEKIFGAVRKGSWVDETVGFAVVESTGEVSSYGDWNNNGRAGANVDWEYRQAYRYQLFTEWGDLEAERFGRARVDWVSRLNISSAIILDKFANNAAFYGIGGGLQNYGGLNDPSLSAALTPGTKAAGGTSWRLALPTEILVDVQSMFAELQTQTGSNLELDTPMILAVNSISEVYLANTNSFGLTAIEMIKKVFPNLRVIQAPQYLSGTTYSAQLIVESIQGQRTVDYAFNEKLRAHRIVPDSSSFRQKKSAATLGAIWYRPLGVAQMAGI